MDNVNQANEQTPGGNKIIKRKDNKEKKRKT